MNQKGLALLLIIGFLVVAAIAGGTYLVMNSDEMENDDEIGDLADWCTSNYAKEIAEYFPHYSPMSDGYNFEIIETRALGFVNYKGRNACHVYTKSEESDEGYTSTSENDFYLYSYSSREELDGWLVVITVSGGQTFNYEFNFENSECVGGSGCDFFY